MTVGVIAAVGFILVISMTIGTGIQIYQSRMLGDGCPEPVLRTAGVTTKQLARSLSTIVVTVGVVAAVGFIIVIYMTIGTGIQI